MNHWHSCRTKYSQWCELGVEQRLGKCSKILRSTHAILLEGYFCPYTLVLLSLRTCCVHCWQSMMDIACTLCTQKHLPRNSYNHVIYHWCHGYPLLTSRKLTLSLPLSKKKRNTVHQVKYSWLLLHEVKPYEVV